MEQFGPQFINAHLMPLLEEMLTDTVQRKKDYLDKLFINGALEGQEKTDLKNYYFSANKKSTGVPFVGEDAEQEKLLVHFVQYIRERNLEAGRSHLRIFTGY